MAVENMDDLLTIPEAGELIGVDRTTVWHWANGGKIATVSAGRGRLAIRRSVAMLAKERIADAMERGDKRWGAVKNAEADA